MSVSYLAACKCRHDLRAAREQAAETAAAYERLQPWAFIYLATRGGGAEVPMYLASRADAEVFCGDDRTQGIGRGGPWMFLFTAAATYLFNPLGHTSLADLTKLARADDGRFEPLAAELGIRLYGRDEFAAVLASLIRQRTPRRDPVAAVRRAGDDAGLFDLLDDPALPLEAM